MKMDQKKGKWNANQNILKLMQYREVDSTINKTFQERYQFSENFVKRLGLEAELDWHQGCVNCLEWSPDGSHLASGSDDTYVILWDPFRHKLLQVIPTLHIGNIFSVKFLGNENVIATAAGDCHVIVQSVTDKSAPLMNCRCHIGRVKRLATCPGQPSLFWSAGEDGFVMQYDMREPHECPSKSKVLIHLCAKGDIKCVAVNPTKPHYIAVGVNDCFVRLYDRRMIKVSTDHLVDVTARLTPQPKNTDCVQYYAAGHLAKEYADTVNVKLACTYIAFNQAGSEMLVNIGGEQIYLFDVNNPRHLNEIQVPQMLPKRPPVEYKQCCLNAKYLNATDFVNKSKDCVCYYMKRAQKSYQRKWMSDIYGAARDYLHIIQHWPDHHQAYIGLIKCLIALNWEKEAKSWIEKFEQLFPNANNPQQIKMFHEELAKCKDKVKTSGNDDGNTFELKNEVEKSIRLKSYDFEKRFLGHCNTSTDIKEANFLGEQDNYICAGSDEGIIFIWDKKTMEIVRGLFGDNSIVNCVQPHPRACLVASSGIDTAVKIWSPAPEDGNKNNRIVQCLQTVVETNQHRMCMDPFESMLASMGFQIQENYLDVQEATCRPS